MNRPWRVRTGGRRSAATWHRGGPRPWLIGLGALAAGLFLGVLTGLVTRPRREQVSGPPVYQRQAGAPAVR